MVKNHLLDEVVHQTLLPPGDRGTEGRGLHPALVLGHHVQLGAGLHQHLGHGEAAVLDTVPEGAEAGEVQDALDEPLGPEGGGGGA